MKEILAKIFGGAAGEVTDKLSGVVDRLLELKTKKQILKKQ